MSDARLEAKAHELADGVVGAEPAARLIAACRHIARAADVRALTALARG